MASKNTNLSALYPQRKRKVSAAGNGKSKAAPTFPASEKPTTAIASLGFSRTQPASLLSSSGMDIDEKYDDLEEMLRQFDMDMKYGPCLGMTRLERWERANKLGMNPPLEVKEIIEKVAGAPACLWEGRV